MSDSKAGSSSYGGRTQNGLAWLRWAAVAVLIVALVALFALYKAGQDDTDDGATTAGVAPLVGGGGSPVEPMARLNDSSTVMGTVLFPLNSAALDAPSDVVIKNAAMRLQNTKARAVVVTGYTDVLGPDPRNDTLSLQRADAVAAQLRLSLPENVSVTTYARGEDSPVAPNTNANGSDNPQNRQQNRRAVIEAASTK